METKKMKKIIINISNPMQLMQFEGRNLQSLYFLKVHKYLELSMSIINCLFLFLYFDLILCTVDKIRIYVFLDNEIIDYNGLSQSE